MGAITQYSMSDEGRAIWDRTFGRRATRSNTTDDGPWKKVPVIPGGSPSRSILGSPAAQASTVRLLAALRSNAPGNWSDDRYEQTLRHFVGITYVAIHSLCRQFSRCEFQVFREDPAHPDGQRPVMRDEPEYELVRLLQRPNRQDSFGKLMYRTLQQKLLTGSGLIYMVPNRLGQPYELYSIPTAIAIPQATTHPDYPDGYYRIQPVYPYGPFSSYPAPASSVGAPIGGQWMFKTLYPHPLLRYDGYTPLTALRLHIDSIEMVDRTRHYMMRRGINPSAVLNGEGVEGASELTEDSIDMIRKQFENDHMGPENMGRLLVAMAGWKLERWGDLPRDMAFESGWDQLSGFILGGGFGITKPAAGMVEDSSYQTLFATMKQLHLVTLEPETEDVGSDFTRQLAPYFGDDLIVKLRLPRIDDHEVTMAKINTGVQAGCLTKNEVRRDLGYSLTHEPWGAEIAGAPPAPPPGMGMPGEDPGMMDPNDPLAGMLGDLDGDEEAPEEDAGALAEGSLGPQMGTIPGGKRFSLAPASGRLSMYDLARRVMKNGH